MKVETTSLPGVLHILPRVFRDDRGYFLETFRESRYAEAGIAGPWTQDNVSSSAFGTVRGLHLQAPTSQGKLVSVLRGRVRDVAVDVRVGSPHFGEWVAVELDDVRHNQLWIPPGFAHGFAVLSPDALFAYKCSAHAYTPADEVAIRWDDPDLGIDWGVEEGHASPKDAAAPVLADVRDRLPLFAS
ncbi:MAG: dTDP-4-dehydrorhamnose 3,5-epimerase [Proteobacteria bacterium]|nr:dTDP-4-dehydrorhamnose 3,5-epimerase [Pseudomonadota bacterium]